MSKTVKWIIAATILIVTGGIIGFISFSMLGFDINRLSTVKYVTTTSEVGEDFNNINIKTDRAEVVFADSDDGKCRVVCFEEEERPHSVRVESDTLMISEAESRKFFWMPGIIPQKPEITVYLPAMEKAGSVIIETDTGDITLSELPADTIDISSDTGDIILSDLEADKVRLSSDTGDITLSALPAKDISLSSDTGHLTLLNLSCEKMELDTDTGDIALSSVITDSDLKIVSHTGDVEFEDSDAGSMVIKTDTGDVEGSLRSGKKFITNTNTGKVSVPDTKDGGTC